MGRPPAKQKGISLGYCDTSTGQRVYPAPPDLLPEQLPPTPGQSKQSLVDVGSDMFANITCWPPLGQSTVIPENVESLRFTVLLEISSATVTEDIDIRLWHNHTHSMAWEEAVFTLEKAQDALFSALPTSRTKQYRHYGLDLPIRRGAPPTNFTVKFRNSSHTGWRWIKDQADVADGHLIFAAPPDSHNISNFFNGLDPEIEVTTPKCDCPNTLLYQLTFSLLPSDGEKPYLRQIKLGSVNKHTKWFALVRLWAPWLAPRQGIGKFEIDKDAVLVSFLREDGYHVVLLAVSGIRDITSVLVHDAQGNVTVKARNDGEQIGAARLLVAVAESFEVANAAVMYEARKLVKDNPAISSDISAQLAPYLKPPRPQWIENWYDGFTYCTWNALGQDLTEKRILDALEDLRKADIIIENLIIDDNWQSVDKGETQFDRGWCEFEANKWGFPDGLKSTISKIRSQNKNIKHIAVWHAMMGYWGCISPDGALAKQYQTTSVDIDMEQVQGSRTVIAGSDITKMYDDFYKFLSSCGVDSVKTDAQFFLDQIVSAKARREMITAYQDAWTMAQLRHFSARAISCMSQSPSILFHSQIPNDRPTIPLRNSDDFFPDVEASHPWHIFCNAHNSLLTQHLNVVPDWDMFQTSHPWGSFHAAARCVSGGTIYFTDTPGHHDVPLIKQMTARTPDWGRRIILRPHCTGKTINAYTGYKDQALLKIGTYVGYARTGTAILGVFNCLENAHGEVIRLADIPGTAGDTEYVIRSFSGSVSKPMTTKDKSSLVHVELDRRGWAILSAHPLRSFDSDGKTTKVGLLGLTGQMTGIAAVLGYTIKQESSGRIRIWTNLKAVGVLGLWISNLPEKSVDKHIMVLLWGAPISRKAVKVSKHSDHVLEIDYESIWPWTSEEQKAVKGFTVGNEVSLEIFIS